MGNVPLTEVVQDIEAVLEQQLKPMTIYLAEAQPIGSIIARGCQSHNGSARYFVVVATNDAARDLEEWCEQQVKLRAELFHKQKQPFTIVLPEIDKEMEG